MKTFNLTHYLLICGIVIIFSCKKSEEQPVDSLVGKYQLASVTFANDFILADTVAIPQGQNVTLLLQSILFGAADCNNPSNTRMQLQENGQIFLLCEGENKSTQNGTWSINNERTELLLTINISFDQGNTTPPFPLTLTGFTETANSISGVIQGVPLPSIFFLAFGLNLTGTGMPFHPVNLNMTLTKSN
jgi:hypothetical protein